MIVKKRFSFVQFLHENSAQQAIRNENGKQLLGQKMGKKLWRIIIMYFAKFKVSFPLIMHFLSNIQ